MYTIVPIKRDSTSEIMSLHPQQNGVVERKHMHLLEVSRAIMFQAKTPTKFWGEAVMLAAAIINVLPSKL